MSSLTNEFINDFDLFNSEDSFLNGEEMQIIDEVSSFATREAQRYVKDVLELKRDTKPIFQKLLGKGLLTQIIEILEIRKNDVIGNMSLGDHIYDVRCYEAILDICIWNYLYSRGKPILLKQINTLKINPDYPRETFTKVSKMVKPYLPSLYRKQEVISFTDFTLETTHLQLFYGLNKPTH